MLNIRNIKTKPALIRGISIKGHVIWQYRYADSKIAEEVFSNLSERYAKNNVQEWLELVKNGKLIKEYAPNA